MIGYAMLGTNDPDRARAFYTPLIDLLGGRALPRPSADTRIWFVGASGGAPVCIMQPWDGAPATVGNGGMLAFTAKSYAQVGAVHAKALELGGVDEGAPGFRGPEEDLFYGAYFRDPDGNKICIYVIGPPEA